MTKLIGTCTYCCMKSIMCSQERWISTSYAFSENLSEYMNIYLIRMKYETFEKFKDFQDEVQNHCNKNINSL